MHFSVHVFFFYNSTFLRLAGLGAGMVNLTSGGAAIVKVCVLFLRVEALEVDLSYDLLIKDLLLQRGGYYVFM